MRNLTVSQLRLRPATVARDFERAAVQDVLRRAGDQPRASDTRFVRSLYRSAEANAFPVEYLCIVDSTLVSDHGFHGMRDPLLDLGADFVHPPLFRLVAGVLPDEATARADSDALAAATPAPRVSGTADEIGPPGLLTLTVTLPFGPEESAFEKSLTQALEETIDVGPTRSSGVTSALWCRADTASLGGTDYLCTLAGYFMQPSLRPATQDCIRAAGGELGDVRTWVHLGTVSGGEFRLPASEGSAT